MSTAECLINLWQQTARAESMTQAGDELRRLMDDELEQGRLTPSLLAACGRLSTDDSLDLWHMGQALAEGTDFHDETGRRSARLAFLPAAGYLEALETWAGQGFLERELRSLVELQCDAVGLEPDEARLCCCPIAFHPAALATANPDELRSLLLLLLEPERHTLLEEHPTVRRHRALEMADPLRGTALHQQRNGARLFVAAVDVPDDVAYSRDDTDEGFFEWLLPVDMPVSDPWQELLKAHGGVDEAAMEVLAPTALAPALFESLHSHILLAWSIDLYDRGGVDQEGHVLEFPEDAPDFITHVSFVPTGHETVWVEARSTLGALVPVEIPLAWAKATGPDGLERCMDNLLNGSLFEEDSPTKRMGQREATEDADSLPHHHERPAVRRLH